MAEKCAFWNEYDSVAGHICYCELAAFNRPVNPNFLQAIGCTGEKRVECMKSMEYAVGKGLVPEELPAPVAAPVSAPVLSCDPPPEIAKTLVGVAQKKAATAAPSLIMLAILAGAYIALGAVLFTIVTNDLALYIGDGLSRLVGGISFSLGLILVILGGAELFTGNNLLAAGYLDRKVTGKQVLNNWFWVYLFNFVGALLVVFLFYYSGIWKANDGGVMVRVINIAAAKTSLTWSEAFFRGILCNWLVCLAVWIAMAGKDAISKILGIMIPISAFVAAGFEHSIANMYFVPMGIIVKGSELAQGLIAPAVLQGITWQTFFINNLIPVTLGNIVGGVVFVAFAYWTCYLRPTTPKKVIIDLNPHQ
ncbi:MAG: formate/nitrite transporter family protein [Bacillota bacterium]|nr:formate/nitrite transporter family protein [Bacillota bacterium]